MTKNTYIHTNFQEVTWGYNHSLVHLANLFLQDGEKLPDLYGYFYGIVNFALTWTCFQDLTTDPIIYNVYMSSRYCVFQCITHEIICG